MRGDRRRLQNDAIDGRLSRVALSRAAVRSPFRQQLLDYAFGFFVAALTESRVANETFLIDEIDRRPIMILIAFPGLVIVVDCNRVLNLVFAHVILNVLENALMTEFR